ncbi:phage GP46 family protein [Brenneria populi subsp. brevivirga]|uniref:phage GP46 family protein n=1 Tax=Brenneria populi TaxID=1505588 RepID=UPI002E18D440|nr:phage GP46 family protein [Brenneria populi subsp. brevivirga]
MTDIKTVWIVDEARGDWELSKGDLASGDDLQTAILISLFTDRQARSDDDYDGDDRRGWWGDTDAEYNIGSRLWLLNRQKLTPKMAQRAENYANEALQWLIDDGVVAVITAEAQIVYPSRLNLTINYQKPDLTNESIKFYWVWEQINAV